jgi:hypothetical protein
MKATRYSTRVSTLDIVPEEDGFLMAATCYPVKRAGTQPPRMAGNINNAACLA